MTRLSIHVERYPSTETNPLSAEPPALFDRRASMGPRCFVAYATQVLIARAQLKARTKQWISQLLSVRRMAVPTSNRLRQQLAGT